MALPGLKESEHDIPSGVTGKKRGPSSDVGGSSSNRLDTSLAYGIEELGPLRTALTRAREVTRHG